MGSLMGSGRDRSGKWEVKIQAKGVCYGLHHLGSCIVSCIYRVCV